jgi:hypothetical protein
MAMDLRFHEVMEGILQKPNERFDRAFRFELDIDMPRCERAVWGVSVGKAVGHVWIDGIANGAPAEGVLEMSPIRKRRLRYAFDFEVDGKKHSFDGHKTLRAPLRGWTTLPGKVFGPDGSELASAVLRFHLRRDLLDLVKSFRLERWRRGGLRAARG